jgi:hypothetical protein
MQPGALLRFAPAYALAFVLVPTHHPPFFFSGGAVALASGPSATAT